jgi:hypothetical protein
LNSSPLVSSAESPDRDEDGNDLGTVTKSVNYSVLYMKAVKALQEAIERIEQLEAKVAALESAVVPFTTMSDDTWLEPLDRRIEEVRRETEAIKKANAALKRLYANNDEAMKRLADS